MKTKNPTIQNNLRLYREAKGLSQEKLGSEIGRTKQTVANLEKGTQPRMGTALAIARVLNLTVEQIWREENQ